VAGTLAAWLGARALQSQLTGVDAAAIWPYLAVAGLVLGLTQLASYLPAKRAARRDVLKALAGV
jgi:ABC-type lipoprotein release transport system permease subunit